MCKKTKVLKYKVVNTNIDKRFIDKNLDLERVKPKGGPGGDGGRKPGSTNKITLAKLSDKVDTLANNLNTVTNNLDKFAKIVTDGFTSINHRIDNVVKVNNLKE